MAPQFGIGTAAPAHESTTRVPIPDDSTYSAICPVLTFPRYAPIDPLTPMPGSVLAPERSMSSNDCTTSNGMPAIAAADMPPSVDAFPDVPRPRRLLDDQENPTRG